MTSKKKATTNSAREPIFVMRPVHPGEILRDEMAELELTARALARALDIPVNRVTQILKGQRAVTADTALRFDRYFRTSPDFWLGLQKDYEPAPSPLSAAAAPLTPRDT